MRASRLQCSFKIKHSIFSLQVIEFLVLFSMNFPIQSLPIENGFSVKFNPISPKEDLKSRKLGTVFAKIPQEFKGQEEIRREDVLNTIMIPQKSEVPSGYTNQVGKVHPAQYVYDRNSTNVTIPLETQWEGENNLNLPLVIQPYTDYKVLVATAPPNVRLGGDDKQTLIYVVFPQDGSGEKAVYNIPIVYFINEKKGKVRAAKKESMDPILIVDSNRTVTGIKSKEIEKFVSFRNKLIKRYIDV